VRFETIVLQEPPKEVVLNFQPGDSIERSAFLVILDNDDAATYEAVVSLNEGRVASWRHVPGVQPRVMLDEFSECEAAVKANPDFRAAIRKRGITDPDLVMVDPWSAGNYGFDDEEGRRLVLARNFLRSSPTDNGYARPIEGGESQPGLSGGNQETRHHRPRPRDGRPLVGGQLRVRRRGGPAVGARPQFPPVQPHRQRLRPAD
jgi:Cu2+-containing amine oxidase